MDNPLDRMNVLVTGASGGLGQAIVKRLAAEGATPIIHFARNEAAAQALLERISGKGHVVQGDLSSREGPEELWSKAVHAARRIHAVVNAAGIRTEVALTDRLETWHSAWQGEFQVNLFAAADLSRNAILHFKQNGGGRIINIASRAGQRGYSADAMAYGASKAALINLTKSIARSFGGDGVTAIAIAPGWIRTDMAEDFIAKNGEAAAVADIPIGAMALPEEVAELTAFVLRPSQRSLNGATLDVNGGSYIR
ncbi:SDR family oxidoreductase [Rhizobium sp. CNPSo 3464]|uniref:SDR family NAD(P)-dependent oxidoreductase n=1 Tax=Rhizobium sp. CNPSo 3464 TaxID=3021406 RepID=UPI0025513CBB|nr:SDR family NAD(P)-dependent oxidoreductase [Rhizobium sp. CNPSo 3464]MDK4740461.1 SDR family oxidoreductase [Rhizobium sp. CNPSo 3464]